jgi:hypothetical protein
LFHKLLQFKFFILLLLDFNLNKVDHFVQCLLLTLRIPIEEIFVHLGAGLVSDVGAFFFDLVRGPEDELVGLEEGLTI